MKTNIKFSNGYILSSQAADKIVSEILEIFKKELPKEALNYEVLNYISTELIVESISTKRVEL